MVGRSTHDEGGVCRRFSRRAETSVDLPVNHRPTFSARLEGECGLVYPASEKALLARSDGSWVRSSAEVDDEGLGGRLKRVIHPFGVAVVANQLRSEERVLPSLEMPPIEVDFGIVSSRVHVALEPHRKRMLGAAGSLIAEETCRSGALLVDFAHSGHAPTTNRSTER